MPLPFIFTSIISQLLEKGKRNEDIFVYTKKTCNPKMGRPKTVNRTARLELRLSDEENELLKRCVTMSGKTKTDVIMHGIELVYGELSKQ